MRRRALIAAAAFLASRAFAQVPGVSVGPGLFNVLSFSTWSRTDKAAGVTLSNGNRTWASSTQRQMLRATTSKTVGKFYFEVTITGTGVGVGAGIAKSSAPLGAVLASDANGYAYTNGGTAYSASPDRAAGVGVLFLGASFTTGDVISVAVDLSARYVYWAKNGVWQASGDPAGNTGGVAIAAGSYFPAAGTEVAGAGSSGATINVGASAFAYSIPSGFNAWK